MTWDKYPTHVAVCLLSWFIAWEKHTTLHTIIDIFMSPANRDERVQWNQFESSMELSRSIGQLSTSNFKEKFQMNYEAFSFTWWIHRISPTVSKVRITLQSPFQSGWLNLKPIVLCQCSSNFWFISVVGYVMTILVCSLICTTFSVFAKGKEVVCLCLVWFGEADTVLYSSRRVRLFVV